MTDSVILTSSTVFKVSWFLPFKFVASQYSYRHSWLGHTDLLVFNLSIVISSLWVCCQLQLQTFMTRSYWLLLLSLQSIGNFVILAFVFAINASCKQHGCTLTWSQSLKFFSLHRKTPKTLTGKVFAGITLSRIHWISCCTDGTASFGRVWYQFSTHSVVSSAVSQYHTEIFSDSCKISLISLTWKDFK